MSEPSAALVLSGGGALGMAHVGALKVLEKKYNFDFITGVSAGSIVGALLAIGKNSTEIEEIILNTNLFSLAFDFSPSNFGFIHGEKIKKLLDQIFGQIKIEQLKTSLFIGATDFSSGERIILKHGKIANAVRSSISVPILFEPFFHPEEKKWLVDGGLSQNFPLDIALEKYSGNKIFGINVIAVQPMKSFPERKFFGKVRNLQKLSERVFRIFFKNQQNHFSKDSRVIEIVPDLEDFKTADIFKLKEILKKGEQAALQVI